jgi:hypothetical protein
MQRSNLYDLFVIARHEAICTIDEMKFENTVISFKKSLQSFFRKRADCFIPRNDNLFTNLSSQKYMKKP